MMLKSHLSKPATAVNTRRAERAKETSPLPSARQIRRDDSRRRQPVVPRPELEKRPEPPTAAEKKERNLAWKMIGIIVIIGVAGLGYLNHVFKTQAILKEVGTLEREYEKARRIHADRKFTFERMTGPSEVYERARQQGLVHGGAAEGVIIVPP